MSRCRCLVVVVLCLTWTWATAVLAQESDPSVTQDSLTVDGNPSLGLEPTVGEAQLSTICDDLQPALFGGPLTSRPKLSGDWCGRRELFRACGYTFDLSTTEYYQGIATGGLQETFRFGGRNDYIVNVDGQKAGLWQGFFVNLHGETVYGESVNFMTGAVVPVSIGRAHPVLTGSETALTAVKFTQALSENFLVYGGKINTIDNIQQPFMPGRGLDAGFMNAALVWNPILGRTMNYATFGVGAAVLANGQPVASLTVYDTNDATTTSSLDELFDNGAIIYPTISLPTMFFGKPGHQSFWGAYSSGQYGILDRQSINIYPPTTPGLPLTTLVRGSWWISYLFDQALWVDPTDPTRSWGVFGNVGISDGEPNPIDWSMICGVGGSSPIRSRRLDTFGIGYYYLSLSHSFKNDIGPIVPVRDERGVELFYSFGVTPWFHLTTDMQVITPILESADTSVVLGLRGKIDF